MNPRAAEFERHRGRLFGIAYRMLGSRADAEDVVQDAYLRWHHAEAEQIRTPVAWLTTVVTRLAIDRLRAAAVERQHYVGPWLPEPVVTPSAPSAEARLELDASMSIAFLRMLERLSPEERAALLLRDVFDSTYPEIARILDKTETACRQLIHRARERVRRDRARFEVSQEEHRRLLDQFSAAMHTADESALRALFATHATVTSDGGGKAAAATRPVEGTDRVARLFAGVAQRDRGRFSFIAVSVNGEPGLVMWAGGRPVSVMAIRAEGGRILELYSMMNPDKLKHVETHPDAPASGGFNPSQS